ncbi:MAG: IS110 family transposase [Anaerococcus vaginalis]|nr:IS110 family transposase [Anaerococcus vaginalis]
MIFLGIDVSKFKHNCFLSNGDNFDLGQHFEIENSREGFDFLFDKLSPYDRDNIRIGLEYTGNYHLNLSRFLLNLNFNIHFFNPFQTSLFRRADSFRNTKTDKVDAFFIAKLLKTTYDSNPTLFEFYHNYDLKSLCRYKSVLKKDRSRLKNSIVSCLDIVFPELCNVCNDVFSKYVLAILYEFSSAYEISKANITRLSNLIKNASRGAYSKDKALVIRDAARNSIGYFSSSVSFQLKQSIDYLYFLDKKIDEINEMIKPLLDEINSPIMSIPGVGI